MFKHKRIIVYKNTIIKNNNNSARGIKNTLKNLILQKLNVKVLTHTNIITHNLIMNSSHIAESEVRQ